MAQAPVDTVGVRAAGARLHALVGILGGRFDAHGGPDLDVLGARAGVGFGELVQLTGYYWRSVDVGEREFLDGEGWGGEAQLNLNAGFGLTPFVAAGVASLDLDTIPGGTAATLAAGLMVPLGPLRVTLAARDYMLGVSGLGGDDTADVTHSWLYSAALTAAIGRPRGRTPVVAARPAPPPAAPPPGAPQAASPGTVLAVSPDTVWVARPAPGEPGVRNYQSDRRIEVPLPLEGSITLRYGPEPAVAPPTAAVAGAPAAAAVTGTPAQPEVQAVPGLSEAAVQRIIDGTVAALLPRLEARDAQRQAQLRADLSAALTSQRELMRTMVEQALAAERVPAASFAVPGTDPDDHRAAAIQAAAARLEAAQAELARIQAARAAGAPTPTAPTPTAPPVPGEPVAGRLDEAGVRLALAELASRHPRLLTTAERDRGPALVVTDAAFETGSALLNERARASMGDVAASLRAVPHRLIFVHGHSDAVGSEVGNQQLSELRAEVLRSLLVQAGLEAGRVHAVGFGAGQPMATNDTAAGRALNRRVEIVIGGPAENGDTR
jgi:outer membrane protein OmpA-like peptidoglycan-associated protein